MIPKSLGKLTHEDMVRKFELRNYHINTHFKSSKGDQYIPEIEFLHKELNYRTSTLFFFKWVGVVLLLNILNNIFNETPEESDNWNQEWNRLQSMKVFAELDEGGEEGDNLPSE